MNKIQNLNRLIAQIKKKNALYMLSQTKKYEITYEQWIVLREIVKGEILSPRDISLKTNKDKSTLTRILDQLEKKEFIMREHKSSDRRLILLVATAKGLDLFESILPIEIDFRQNISRNITEEEFEVTNSALNKLLNNITEKLEGI